MDIPHQQPPARNTRLESFLMRKMTPSNFESIRYYEPCIVRRGDSVQYQTAVITRAALYAVDEPPRQLTELVPLQHIVSVEREHDVVEFLRPPLRDKVQHVRVQYRRTKPRHAGSGSGSGSGGRAALAVPGGGCAAAAADEDSSFSTGQLALPGRPLMRCRSDCGSERRRTLSRLEEEVEELSGRLRVSGAGGGGGGGGGGSGGGQPQHTAPRSRHSSISSGRDADDGAASDWDEVALSLLLERRRAVSTGSSAPAPRRSGSGSPPLGSGSAADDSELEARGMTRSQSALPAFNRCNSVQPPPAERSRSALDRPRNVSAAAKKRSTSLDDVRDGKAGRRAPPPELCHLYLLRDGSPFQRHLYTAWQQRLISQTLAIEQPSAAAGRCDRQQLEQLFEDLRGDLLQCRDWQHKCALLGELKTGAARYPRVRDLFWKDARLLDLLIGDLTHVLVTTSSFCGDGVGGGGGGGFADEPDEEQMLRDREEQLDAAVLLMDTLAALLQQADAAPRAAQLLQQEKCCRLGRLLRALLTPPWVPPQYASTVGRALCQFREFVAPGWEHLPEAELIKLLAEVTNTCTGAVYELVQVLQHIDPSGAILRQALAKTNIERHLRVAVTQLLAFLYPARGDGWSPAEAVLVLQHVRVLQTLLRQLPGTLAFVQTHFAEEFRYYVSPVVVGYKLPASYPLRRQLLAAMESLARHIRGATRPSGAVSRATELIHTAAV